VQHMRVTVRSARLRHRRVLRNPLTLAVPLSARRPSTATPRQSGPSATS
jgi:hypothetical protein